MRVASSWVGGCVASLVLGTLVVGGCGLEDRKSSFDDDLPEVSAARLGADGSVAGDVLTSSEREALAQSRVSHFGDDVASEPIVGEDGEPFGEKEDKLDKAGKVGLSLLTVGLSLAAAAAPFLLF